MTAERIERGCTGVKGGLLTVLPPRAGGASSCAGRAQVFKHPHRLLASKQGYYLLGAAGPRMKPAPVLVQFSGF
jgi:hypothetical protein